MLLNIQQAFVVLLVLVVRIQCQITLTFGQSKLIGYYIATGSIETLTASYSWNTSGVYAGDCYPTTGSCSYATECFDRTLYLDSGDNRICVSGASCVTATIFAASPSASPSALYFGCHVNWSAYTLYRESPATTTVSSTITSVPPSPSFVSTPTPAPTLVLPPGPPDTIPVTPKQKGKIWIAGAVIGPVVGIALIAAAIYWWRRRSGKAHEAVDMDSQGRGHSELYAPVQQYHNKDSDGQGIDLPVAQPPIELAANNLR